MIPEPCIIDQEINSRRRSDDSGDLSRVREVRRVNAHFQTRPGQFRRKSRERLAATGDEDECPRVRRELPGKFCADPR